MKYLKTYEYTKKQLEDELAKSIGFSISSIQNINNEPDVGDYVICHKNLQGWTNSYKFNAFINENIGQCVELLSSKKFSIKYEKVPKEIKHFFIRENENLYAHCRHFSKEDIIYYSNDKEDCEVYLASKKYNL